MNVTRKQALLGSAAMIATSACNGDFIRSNAGAKSMTFAGNNSSSDAALQNWLDFFENGYAMSTFEDYSIIELGNNLFSNATGYTPLSISLYNLERIVARNVFYSSRIKDLYCPKLLEIYGDQQFQGSPNLEVIDFPSLNTIHNFTWFFWNRAKFGITLYAGGGINETLFEQPSFKGNVSLVGTSEPYVINPSQRHYAYYYANGEYLRNGAFGGGSSASMKMELFAAARNWPSYNVIKIHCIRIYDRALSSDEIHHNYLIDKVRFNLQ